MNIYGIDLKGKFKNKNLSSLPTWTLEDKGREIYVNGIKYYGNNVEWVEYVDNKSKISSNDTTFNYIENKLTSSGNTISITTSADGSNESIILSNEYERTEKYLVRYNTSEQLVDATTPSWVTFDSFTKASSDYQTQYLNSKYNVLTSGIIYVLSYNLQVRNVGETYAYFDVYGAVGGDRTWSLYEQSYCHFHSDDNDYVNLYGKAIIKPSTTTWIGVKAYTRSMKIVNASFTMFKN